MITVDRLPCRCSHSICHQLWLEHRSQRHPLGLERGADILLHCFHRQRPTEAPARQTIATQPLLAGQMGRSRQRYIPGFPNGRVRVLFLPIGAQYWRRGMARGLQLGYCYLLGYLRVGWYLLCVGWRGEIYRAGVSGQGGVRHGTCILPVVCESHWRGSMC